MKRGKHGLNIWKNGISKELECLQCHYPAERQERKRFSVQEFKLSFFQRKVLTLVHQTICQVSVLVKGEWSFPNCAGILKDVRCAPTGTRGTESITHPLGYSFILVWRLCPLLQ